MLHEMLYSFGRGLMRLSNPVKSLSINILSYNKDENCR